ncbi:MAG: phytanoyl-CoA dioxygenase family protein [Actinobacteria bacterium]|nr:MAG: phytanoyl-CoA dioxygenase family protein [Actinomycetota bacterium]
MHRKRTRFAARVHRVATALERRGIVATYELNDRLLANRSARRRYTHEPPVLDELQQGVLDQLRPEGYATIPFSELAPELWGELEQEAARFVAETETELAREKEGSESALRRREGKEFLVRKYAYDVELSLDDPWLRLGLNTRMLDIANAYLGMWAKLEYVDVWYTPPLEDPERRSSQRWHRDFNDRHLLKAFLYLVDVDEETGPFEYVPRTAPGNELEHLWPWRPLGENYPPEQELAEKIADRTVSFTAPKGTIIFCNTCGFHRGGFATGKARALATVTYSSPASLASLTERNFSIQSDGSNGLRPAQRYSVS